MTGEELLNKSREFEEFLRAHKENAQVPFNWYPYGTMNNFAILRGMFDRYPLEDIVNNKRIADIGGADGDLAFFMQSLGYTVDMIDYGPTNFNNLSGARYLIDRLGVNGSVQLIERDIDSQFELPTGQYDLIFLLGILYHLKNPYYILEKLARHSKHLVISTRVMRFTPDMRRTLGSPLAYLLDPHESNNDPTNYWIFTQNALDRLVHRCGWDVLYSTSVGDTAMSNPADADRDERAFMLLRSRNF